MARYSSVLVPYSLYSTGVYGSGDIPDLRLKYLVALPTDRYRSHLDGDGNSVFGRVTLFWDSYANLGSDIKILRSTHGPAVTHNDPYCPVIAATKQSFKVVGTTVRYDNGYTVVSTDAPHLLKSGDTVTISGTGTADGTWVITTVLNPAQFAFLHTTLSGETSTTGGSVLIRVGRDSLPTFGVGERSYTDTSVIPGIEYHYSLFVEDPTPGVTDWSYGGTATIRVPKDFESFQRLIDILPPYLTNQQFDLGGIPTVDTLRDTDYDLRTDTPASMTKLLAGLGWVWDDLRTDLTGASRLWDPQQIPNSALPHALATMGIDTSPSLNNRALRSMLSNSDTINGSKGTSRGIIALAESITGMSASVGSGYNLMPTVDDAEFYGGTGHWVASPVGADKSTITSRNLTSSNPGYSGGDTVSAIAYISPAGPATGDSPTTGSNALAIPAVSPYLSTNPVLHLGFGAAVQSVSPNTYSTSLVYKIDTVFAHGLEVGDVVTMHNDFPLNNTTTNPAMIVTDVPSATSVTVKLEKDISSTNFSGFFGSGTSGTPWNLLCCVPGRRNPFAVANGIAVQPNTSYTLSFEESLTSGTTAQAAIEVYYYDDFGTYLGKYSLGTLSGYEAAVSYNNTDIAYNATGLTLLTAASWTKVVVPVTTIDGAKYMAVKLGPTGISDYTVTHYFRRFMVTKGSAQYNYQSPRMVSIDLNSSGSTSAWGAPRTNLVLDPGFESSGALTVTSPNTAASDSTVYRLGSKSYKTTVGSGSTDNRVGTYAVTLPSTGTYTASSYWQSNNQTASNTSVRLTLDGYVNGYSSYEYSPNTTSASIVAPPVSPVAFCGGPDNTYTTSAQWMTTNKTQWYDQQAALEVVLANASDTTNVVGYRSGVIFPKSYDDGNSGRVPVSVGSTYRAGAWVRMPTNSAPVGVSVLWYDTAGNFVSETLDDSLTVLLPSTNSRDYTWVSTTATAPSTKNPYLVQVTAGSSTGTSRKLTTSGTHGLVLGDVITIATGDTNYDGTYTLSNLTSVASSGTSSTTTRTITTAASHGLIVGDTVVISFGDVNYDGTFTVATVPTSTTFTYTASTSTASAATLTRTSVTGLALASPTAIRYTGSTSTGSAATLSTYPNITASRGVAAAVISVYVSAMTSDLLGKSMYVTCPTFTLASAPEIIAFQSTGSLLYNYISNPSFETNTAGWLAANSATIARSTTVTYDGKYSLAATVTGNQSGAGFQFSVTAGVTYTATAWVKPGNTPVYLSLQGTPFSPSAIGPTTTGSGWQSLTVTGTAVATGIATIYLVTTTAPSSGSDVFYIDNIVVEYGSTGTDSTNAGWKRSYTTFNVSNPNDLTMNITGRAMGSSPAVGAIYNSDSWMVESGDVLMSYFDGSSAFQTAPYYAGWSGTANASTSISGKTLPSNAVADNSMAVHTMAVGHLKNQLSNNVAVGTPYRVTLNGFVDNTSTPVSSIDPSFTKTYVSTIY